DHWRLHRQHGEQLHGLSAPAGRVRTRRREPRGGAPRARRRPTCHERGRMTPPPLSLVPAPGQGDAPDRAGGRLDIAVIADRIGWEEKAILVAARERGARADWLDDGALCCGSRE